MSVNIYYLGAVTLLGGSMFLFNKSSPWSSLSEAQYDKARIARAVGIILAIMALLCFLIAVFDELFATSP